MLHTAGVCPQIAKRGLRGLRAVGQRDACAAADGASAQRGAVGALSVRRHPLQPATRRTAMNETQICVVGNVVSDLRFVVTDSGVPLASFRMVTRPRRYDRASGSWADGEPSFFVVNCWRTLAENVGSSIGRGDPVVVTGRLKVRAWQKDETRGTSVEIDAASVGHDLRWGTTAYRRVRRADALLGVRDARDRAETTDGVSGAAAAVTGGAGGVTGSGTGDLVTDAAAA
jgi:single-strand DNA-binding protein